LDDGVVVTRARSLSETALFETDIAVLNDFRQRGTWGGRTISKEAGEFTFRRYRI
jgi:hypothetical protein